MSRALVTVSAVLMYASLAAAGTMEFDWSAPASAATLASFDGGQVLSLPGGVACMPEGAPNLPGVARCYVIPQGTSLVDAEVEVVSEVSLGTGLDILPVRMAVIGSDPGPFLPDPLIYLSASPWPAERVVEIVNGNRTGFRLGTVQFTPFSWNPVTGELRMVTEARVTLTWESDPSVPVLTLGEAQVAHAAGLISSFVANPGDLAALAPAVRPSNGTDWSTWVCIGASTHQATVQPLVNLRNSMGMTAEYVTTEWIYANYTGYDTQEKIRNYLKDAYQNHGLQYALIIGDWGETQRISKLYTGGMTLNETTDLYYSDLDGTWDLDGDHLYGENTDGLDYYSDISVGRFSTNNATQVQTQVQKTIEYETLSPAGTWRTRAILCGAGLWPEYNYWGSFVCDSICARIPAGWIETKLYENSGGHPNNQIEVVNQGVSYGSPQGHGFSSGIYWYYSPTNMFTNANYSQLTNWGKFPVFHSIACLAGQLSANGCVAERLMFSPSGGTIAVMMNSNNGFGAPPSMGPSEHLEVHFADQMFVYNVPRIGDMQSAARDAFKAAGGMNLQNWVLQENNMLGDPATLFVVHQTGLGGDEPSPQAGAALGVYPNPAAGSFSVAWGMPSGGDAVIGLYDMTGRLVASGPASGESGVSVFQTAGLSAGCYLVRIDGSAGAVSSRVVVLAD